MPKHVRTLTSHVPGYRPGTRVAASPEPSGALEAFLRSLVPSAADRAMFRELAIARIMAEPPVPISDPASVRAVRDDGRWRDRLHDGKSHPITITRGSAKVTVSERTFARVGERRQASSQAKLADQSRAQREQAIIAKLRSLGTQADYD